MSARSVRRTRRNPPPLPSVRGTLLSALLACGFALAEDPPPCAYEDRPTIVHPSATGEWSLLDTAYRLPEDWRPPDLVPARLAGFDDDRLVREAIVPDLAALLRDARAAGHDLELQSAFRSYAYQAETFESWVRQLGREDALATSARAGHSEHQLGTAVDLRTAGGPAPWTVADWAATDEGAWLERHGPSYGFVMSYPRDSRDATCYAYEPWHWRWVGRDLAARVEREERTLRDVLWELHASD